MEKMPRTLKVSDFNCRNSVIPVLAMVLVAALGFARSAPAQTLTTLHGFSGADGATPMAGVTIDAAENLYGTTTGGGSHNCPGGCGTVFKLRHTAGGWVLSTLYEFQGGADSAYPEARVVFGPDGVLYGTTAGTAFGNHQDDGTVFKLTPPASICKTTGCPWTKTILYSFRGVPDGWDPQGGDLAFDQQGNIYGTTFFGGARGDGTVFKLTHSNGSWTESVLYSFTGMADGAHPAGSVIVDNAGNLYGTTYQGGYNVVGGLGGDGVVFELTRSGSGWSETVLYTFMDQTDGAAPAAGLVMDGAGNFYGTTAFGGGGPCFDGGYGGCGSVFRNQGVTLTGFTHSREYNVMAGPAAPVTLDAQGNIYGTTLEDGAYGAGNIFKLSAGDYAYTSLYDFGFGGTGANPASNVSFDSSGNMYGTTSSFPGTVWQLTP